jgi:hypothetical protein
MAVFVRGARSHSPGALGLCGTKLASLAPGCSTLSTPRMTPLCKAQIARWLSWTRAVEAVAQPFRRRSRAKLHALGGPTGAARRGGVRSSAGRGGRAKVGEQRRFCAGQRVVARVPLLAGPCSNGLCSLRRGAARAYEQGNHGVRSAAMVLRRASACASRLPGAALTTNSVCPSVPLGVKVR